MDKTDGILYLEAIVECPCCGEYIDLFKIDYLHDDGEIFKVLLGEYYGTEDWGVEINCPFCDEPMVIGEISW